MTGTREKWKLPWKLSRLRCYQFSLDGSLAIQTNQQEYWIRAVFLFVYDSNASTKVMVVYWFKTDIRLNLTVPLDYVVCNNAVYSIAYRHTLSDNYVKLKTLFQKVIPLTKWVQKTVQKQNNVGCLMLHLVLTLYGLTVHIRQLLFQNQTIVWI